MKATPTLRFSPRQVQVLDRLSCGETTLEIATALHISVKTVEQRYRQVRQAVGLRNLHELIVFATWRAIYTPERKAYLCPNSPVPNAEN